jgi:hypothetical protein
MEYEIRILHHKNLKYLESIIIKNKNMEIKLRQ